MEDHKSDLQQDKPRRLEDETADYLAKIEQQFTDNLDREEKLNLVENVLSEINQRTASAACDRRTNYLIEKLCFAADIKNLLIIARRFAPYSLFLARNRYSSHILQAILSRMCYVLKFDDYGDVAPEDVIETMQEICTPVMKEASWLILEQSASHVVRSMLSLLAGLPVIAERKGKNSKHQHSIALSEPLDALIEPGLFYISSKAAFPVPSSFHDILISTVESLLKLGTKELERLIADFSSSAVLGLLIRILSNPDLLYTGTGRALAVRIFCAALGWKDYPTKPTPELVPEGVQAVFYAMAGDRAGSYFLEALIECSAPSFLASIVGSTIVGKCKEYVEDGSGNFVLQAILRRISCELPRWSGSEAKPLINISVQIAEELIQSDYFTHVVNFKGGVVLWLLAVVNGLQDSHADLCEKVGEKVLQAWVDSALATDDAATATSATTVAKTLLAAIPALPPNPTAAEIATHKQQQLSAVFSSKLLPSVKGENVTSEQPAGSRGGGKGKTGPQPPVDPRDTTQLLVARVIGALLKNKAPEVAQLTIKAFANLTPEALKYVATSGAVSRAVLDVFFEVTAQTAEFKIMGINLAAIGVELAGHYVGQHIVRQSFDCADLRGKEKWALTLSNANTQLSRTKEGTASLRLVNAELYQRDATEWRSTIKRKLKAESLLKELEAPVPVPTAAPSKPKQTDAPVPAKAAAASTATKRSAEKTGSDNEEGSDTEAAGQAGGEKTGRKRKRKRPNKANIV